MTEKKFIRLVSAVSSSSLVGDKDTPDIHPPKARKWMNSLHLLAVRVAEKVFLEAGLERPCPVHPTGLMVEIDDPEHGWNEWTDCLQSRGLEGWRQLPPLWILNHLPNTTASHLAIQFGLRGPVQTVPGPTVLNHHPLQTAADWLETGQARLVLAVQISSPASAMAIILESTPDADGALQPHHLNWEALVAARLTPEIHP